MSLLCRATLGIILNTNCKYSITTSICINSNILKQSYCLVPRVFKCTRENNSTHLENLTTEKNNYLRSQYVQFEQMVENRRKEARRSIVVQVHSEKSCVELHAYCSLFGCVKGIYHYSLPEPLHFAIVEFQHEDDVKQILKACRHMNISQVIPAVSPLLWFRTPESSSFGSKKSSTQQTVSSYIELPLIRHNGNSTPSKTELRKMLLSAATFSDQITLLHDAMRLGDVATRLRFLTARQLEMMLAGLFPRATALPFGSTVNGFGNAGCDLDVAFHFDDGLQASLKDDGDVRLKFHAKSSLVQSRVEVKRHMEVVGDLCELFLPGCSRVRRILMARVPIIKYKQDLMDVECDLSMTNGCAVHMSELLYVFGSIDYRVRPLVFAVRCWAREVSLTCESSGAWITNFSLTLLVLFFLQNVKVLPSLQMLAFLASEADERITPDGVNCTFLRDIAQLRGDLLPAIPSDDLESLARRFFDFYASFDFGSKAVSLVRGVPIPKPDHSPLHIVNPLEGGLNVSKNVSAGEVERLRLEVSNAAWNLENEGDTRDATWGLPSLFESGMMAPKTHSASRTLPPTQHTRKTTSEKRKVPVANDGNSTGQDRNTQIPRVPAQQTKPNDKNYILGQPNPLANPERQTVVRKKKVFYSKRRY